MSATVVEFLQHIAMGAGAVLALLLALQVAMPRRASVLVRRRMK